MASIGSSDGSNNRSDEIVRRNREEYQTQSSDQTKKHQKELRRLNEQHYAEVEKLKSDYNARMKSMAGASKDAISERDYQYQKDMEDMRAMHRKQIQSLADESGRREDTLRATTDSDSNFNRKNTQERFDKLSDDYMKQLREREDIYQRGIAESREAQQKAVSDNRNKLEAHHNEEMSAMRNDRNETVGSLQKQYKDYRDNAEGRIKSQDLKHMQDQQRASNDMLRAVKRERDLRVESEQILRDGFQDGLQETRGRFEEAKKKEQNATNSALSNMKTSAIDRVENQVRRLEQEKEDLKETKVRNELQLKQNQSREMRNMRDAFGDNMRDLAEQRDEAVRQANSANRDDVLKVHKNLGKQLVDTNRFYRERMEESNRINREAYENIKGDFDGRNAQTKSIADQRVALIYDQSEQAKARMIEKQQEDHSAQQVSKHDEMKQLRASVDSERNAAVRSVHDQMRKQELQHTERMANVVNKYEKQITALKDQMMREKNLADENLKRTVEELQRAHKVAMDQVDARNRDQMRQASAVHSDEVRQINKRHEAKLDQVITEVKKG